MQCMIPLPSLSCPCYTDGWMEVLNAYVGFVLRTFSPIIEQYIPLLGFKTNEWLNSGNQVLDLYNYLGS